MATELSEESSYLRSLLSIHKIIVIINQSKRASERASERAGRNTIDKPERRRSCRVDVVSNVIEIALLGVVAVMERSGDKERKQEGQM
jgi:hypothetical protein